MATMRLSLVSSWPIHLLNYTLACVGLILDQRLRLKIHTSSPQAKTHSQLWPILNFNVQYHSFMAIMRLSLVSS